MSDSKTSPTHLVAGTAAYSAAIITTTPATKLSDDQLIAAISQRELQSSLSRDVKTQISVSTEPSSSAHPISVSSESFTSDHPISVSDESNPTDSLHTLITSPTYVPYSEILTKPDIERLTGTKISSLACLYEPSISYQQYLSLREKQVNEFAEMSKWYKKRKAELELSMQDISDENERRVKIAEQMHTIFMQRYRDMFYLHQTSAQEILDPNAPGHSVSTVLTRMFNEDDHGRWFGYNSFDEKCQILQLYALMELFDGVSMHSQRDSFTIDIDVNGKSVNLVSGTVKGEMVEFSCAPEALKNPNLCDKAIMLMVDHHRRLLGRTYQHHDNSFPICGNANPQLLLRLYQVALIQNLNPTLQQDHLDSIISYDSKHKTNFAAILAHLMYIKQQAGMSLTETEENFLQQQKVVNPKDQTSECSSAEIIEQELKSDGMSSERKSGMFSTESSQLYLARRLQAYNLEKMEKKFTAKHGVPLSAPSSDMAPSPLPATQSSPPSPARPARP